MSEGGDAGPAIPRPALERLAQHFDRFEYATDPLSTDAREAQAAFEDGVKELYAAHGESIFPTPVRFRHCSRTRSDEGAAVPHGGEGENDEKPCKPHAMGSATHNGVRSAATIVKL
jgi:hypothetical protein